MHGRKKQTQPPSAEAVAALAKKAANYRKLSAIALAAKAALLADLERDLLRHLYDLLDRTLEEVRVLALLVHGRRAVPERAPAVGARQPELPLHAPRPLLPVLVLLLHARPPALPHGVPDELDLDAKGRVEERRDAERWERAGPRLRVDEQRREVERARRRRAQ